MLTLFAHSTVATEVESFWKEPLGHGSNMRRTFHYSLVHMNVGIAHFLPSTT